MPRDNRREAISLFLNALPLFLMWLTLPLVLLILSSWYQSERLLGERADRTHAENTYNFSGSNSENLVLHVSTPHKLRVDPDAPYDDSLVVWLTGPLVVPPTAYVFFINASSDSVDLVGENGIPIANTVSLIPAQDNTDAKTLYLRANPSFVLANEELVLFVGAFRSPATARVLKIPIERLWLSRLRHFLDALFGFPTLIGGLLTAIAGFGLQQWKILADDAQQKKDEEQKRKQRDEDEIYKKVEAAFTGSDYLRAFDLYQKSLESGEGFSARLERLFEDCARHLLNHEFDNLKFSDASRLSSLISETKLESLKSYSKDQQSRTLSALRVRDPSKAKKLIDELAKYDLISITEVPDYSELEKGVAFAKLGQLLKLYPEIVMGSDDSEQAKSADIDKGKEFIRINANPFGSAKVEKDQRFDWRFDRIIWKRDLFGVRSSTSIFETIGPVYPVSLEHMEDRSQLILGKKGSGKTAIALLMAGLSLVSEKKMLPIYIKISANDDMTCLSRKIASVLMNYFVKNCWEFTEMHPASQSAIAVLFTNYLAAGPELSFRLYMAGLSNEHLSNDFHTRLKELADLATSIRLNHLECANLLRQTCPPEYKKMLFLFDYQDNGKQISKGNQEIVRFLQNLDETGTIFKVFSAPSGFSSAVISRLDLSVTEISWDDEKIKKALQTRMENFTAGAGIFFDPSLRRASRDLLAQASKGAPGTLIRLGNEILAHIGRKGRVLTKEDAEAIFGISLVQKVIQESSTS